MSLAEQSQQWYPTTVQVTVLQARNLKAKGKNGTNDAYAIIQLAKEKYSTSVVEKSPMPVWKEEATFDLPMFHQGNEQRCTLYIVIMHRALVGLDQFLGQAVINLVELQENKNRNRTEWFKLQSKEGKKEKERGEVEVDIQFKRNNMTASMFDLSAKDKPRSRIGKLKDKIRGKKKDGFSDSASAIVPSVTQVLTDSEGEGSADSPGTKKKSKLKSLFTSKSNLQRNVSQSMSTLESLPEKNSSLTSSRSSGLNIDSPEVKKKFKFLAHKRTGSNESKSRDPLSLLGERSKRNSAEQSNLCINGRHVYTEEPEGPKTSLTGSNQSLNSSGQGSVEDLRRVTERQDSGSSADSLKGFGIPSYRVESQERAPQEQQRRQEEENRLAEEKRKAEARRLSEERSRQEELERKKLEEARKAEELKQQEEAKKSEKSSSLLNMVKWKKDIGKKEDPESPPASLREGDKPKPAPRQTSNEFVEVPLPESPHKPFNNTTLSERSSSNLSEESPLKLEASNPFEEMTEFQHGVRSPSSANTAFPGRSAKVSAVKPRLVVSPKAETNKGRLPSPPAYADHHTKSPAKPPPPYPPSSPIDNLPSESPDIFASLHTSFAPSRARKGSRDSSSGSTENLVEVGSSDEKSPAPGYTASPKKEDPRPKSISPSPTPMPTKTGTDCPEPIKPKPAPRSLTLKTATKSGFLLPISEVEMTNEPLKPPARSPPDYDSLFTKKKHGVKGQIQWDKIVAEMDSRNLDLPPVLGKGEMSVDSPEISVDNPQLPAHQDEPEAVDIKVEDGPNEYNPELMASVTWRRLGVSNNPSSSSKSGKVNEGRPDQDTLNKFASKVLGEKIKGGKNTVFSAPPDDRSKEKPVYLSYSSKQEPSERKLKEAPPVKAKPNVSDSGSRDGLAEGSTDAVFSRNTIYEGKDTKVLKPALADIHPKNVAMLKDDRVEENYRKTPPLEEKIDSIPSVTERDCSRTSMFSAEQQRLKGTNSQELVLTFEENDKLWDPKTKKESSESLTFKKHTSETFPYPREQPVSGKATSDTLPNNLEGRVLKNEHKASPEEEKQVEKSPNDTSPISGAVSPKKKQAPLPPPTKGGFLKTEKKPEQNPQQQLAQKDQDLELSSTGTKRQKKQESLISTGKAASQSKEHELEEDSFSTNSPQPPSSSLSISPPSPLPQKMEISESSPQPVGAGGKMLLRAWVSPSEAQPIAAQSSSAVGGGTASTQRRPHPVKPMNSQDTQQLSSAPLERDPKLLGGREIARTKLIERSGSGPYSQLTQEELITLVVKQQEEMSKKDSKILELEEYIDLLLVRVIEEKPSILLAMSSSKKAL
ncbi:RFIP1 protein, partial [Atractosteus spatula]|nr:RFIP1 protein [Atractosteus spatula]